MKPIQFLLIYLAAVFLGGALLAAWLYWAAQAAAGANEVFGSIAEEPFRRYVNRCLLGLALLGLWPFFKAIHSDSLEKLGFRRDRDWMRSIARGALLGFSSLAIVAAALLLAGNRTMDPTLTPGGVLGDVMGALAAAAVVSVLEETLFRGGLQGAIARDYSWKTALLWSSAVYSIVHFFAKPPDPESVEWYSGLIVLGKMSQGFLQISELVPGFLNLLLAGMILGVARHFSGALYYSIGLHAGWIFWLKMFGAVTDSSAGGSWKILGTKALIDGWAATVVLTLALIFLWKRPITARIRPRRDKPIHQAP